jgi:RNA polymerase sigma-70 factor, ECF subfamily
MGEEALKIDDLIERAARGELAARQRLLTYYRDHLRRMIAVRLDKRLAARIDPSDVVQETLIEAHSRLEAFLRERPLPLLSWLRQIAAERVIDAHRRHLTSQRRSVTRERVQRGLCETSAMELARCLANSQTSPSDQAIHEEELARLRRALYGLSERHREVLVMRHLERLNINEIASVMGISPGAVKARILRALLKLRDTLGTTQD